MSPARRRRDAAGRGRGPRAKRPSPANQEPDEELETLEPLPDDEGTGEVRVDHELTAGGDYDVRLAIDVGDMDKGVVADAIGTPLSAKVGELGSRLRWQRVLVTFGGSAMVSSAARERVLEVLVRAKPLSVTVQRGYGDEVVHRAEPPSVELVTSSEPGDVVGVEVRCGALEARDLAFALRRELPALAARAAGKKVHVSFGETEADADTRELLRSSLVEAGATRIRILDAGGEDVIHDADLERRVVVRPAGGEAWDTEIEIAPGDDPKETNEGLQLVLPRARARIAASRVCARFARRPPLPEEVACLRRLTEELGARRVAVAHSGQEPDLLSPPLLTVAATQDGTILTVTPEDRSPAALRAAFRRESPGLAADVAGRPVTVDWPGNFVVDDDLENECILGDLARHEPRSIAYSFGSQNREPVQPSPVTVRRKEEGGETVGLVQLDSDAGRPGEVMRAFERRFRRAREELGKGRVDVEVLGSGLITRTMRRSLQEQLSAAEVEDARLVVGGVREVLLPRLLTFEELSGTEFRVQVTPGGRDAAQVERDAAAELEERGLEHAATVRVARSPHELAVVAALVAHGAARVFLESAGGACVHPALFAAPEREGDDLVLRATPRLDTDDLLRQVGHELPAILSAADALGEVRVTLVWPDAVAPYAGALARAIDLVVAAGPAVLLVDSGEGGRPRQVYPEVVREWVTLLGRRDEAEPPLSLLGVDYTAAPDDIAAIEEKLSGMGEVVDGRRVLVVFRAEGADVAAHDAHPLARAVRTSLEPRVRSLLFYRDAGRPEGPHFEVVYSTVDGLAVGTRVRDPRGPRVPDADPSQHRPDRDS